MKCIERKIRLSGEEISYECELLSLGERHGIVRYVIDADRSVDGVRLPAGTVTLALYFADRPYNLYYWIAPRAAAAGAKPGAETSGRAADRSTIGEHDPWSRDIAYYFNIADPVELSKESIAYRDLVVDVLVLPDGSTRVLDEAELPENLDPGLRRRIAAVRDEILLQRSEIIAEARELLRPFAVEE